MQHRSGAWTQPRIASLVLPWLLGLTLAWPSFNEVRAQPAGDATATTESSCNFGMAKNQAKGSCEVPMLAGCAVANFPGTNRPWSNLSKGGNTSCRFDEKGTDWKTRITGSCGPCKTQQCTARFGVMFDCSSNMPPPIARQSPQRSKP